MMPSARVQAAIDLLDLIIAAARGNGPPADRLITDWFRSRRYAGSADRRAVRELVYRAVRACGEVPHSGRAAMLRLAAEDPTLAALFDGVRHGPAPIRDDEPVASGGVAPEWLVAELAASGVADASGMLARAPVDLRVNTLRADLETLDLPHPGERTLARNGLRFPPATTVDQWPAYLSGAVEVQDTGSQLAGEAVGAQPGELIIDMCAGAGGKSLSVAADMANRGSVIACDTDRARLSRLPPRAERAGAANVETVLLDPRREAERLVEWRGRADAVLVDAPCSGTGTWRRNPEARWRLTPDQLALYVQTQERLLDMAADLVRAGGRLVYVTCSLLDAEGASQVARFLDRQTGWQPAPIGFGTPRGGGVRLSPWDDGTDGFFIARLDRL